MSITAAEPVPDHKERAHLRLCGAVTLETMVCFALPAVALVIGAVYAPFLLLSVLADPQAGWAWRPLVSVVLGWAGFLGIGRLLLLLWNRPQSDSRRRLTLLAIACGCAASFVHEATIWMGK